VTRLLVLDLFYLKDIDHVYVRTAEANGILFLAGQLTAVSENVNIRESNMLRHGTEGASLRIPVPGIPDLMSMVASPGTFLVD
jgi:hypothetical protein